MIDRRHKLAVTRQAQLLALSRASVYYTPQPVPAAALALMRRIDALHLQFPFAGSRMMRDLLREDGTDVGRRRAGRTHGVVRCAARFDRRCMVQKQIRGDQDHRIARQSSFTASRCRHAGSVNR
jgi:hypothetical protein